MIKDKKVRDPEFPDDIQILDKPVEEVEKPKKVETPVVKKSVDVDAFIERKLKVINEWPDGAKKRSAAERLLKNKEVKNGKMQ